jgi:phosphate acetyltransferase
VPLAGVIINKVYRDKYQKINRVVPQGLKNVGIACQGVIPYRKELTYPSIERIKEKLGLELMTGEEHLENKAKQILVGAMEPQNMVRYIRDGSFVVVPGDRVDNIVISVNAHLMGERSSSPRLSGMLLTGGLSPDMNIINLLCQVDVPVLLCDDDTATAAYKVRELVAKITPEDTDKVTLASKLIQEYVDVDAVLERVEG